MKKILRLILFNSIGVVLLRYVWGGPQYNQTLANILTIGLLLSIFETIIKPVINLLLLPINILTLGLIKVVINTLGLYFVEFIVDNFRVGQINSLSINWEGISISSMQFSGFASYVILSLTLSIFISFASFISKSKD